MSAHLPTPKGEAEYVCLECALPECNDKDSRCMYHQLKPSRTAQTHSKGKTCPHPSCTTNITNHARTCIRHTWYK